MITTPEVSIIIPTYNRTNEVRRALRALNHQTYPCDLFEVIVVDDGSMDDISTITKDQYNFKLNYIRQQNSGATFARNNGAKMSVGQVLIFMDDDVTLSNDALEAIIETIHSESKILVQGNLVAYNPNEDSGLLELDLNKLRNKPGRGEYVHFTSSNTQLLGVKRTDFFNLKMFQDPTNGQGWPNWDDVDFGYRAHLKGYKLVNVSDVIGIHWDYALADLPTASNRWKRAAISAVYLFQVHPGLIPHIPMFFDKTPIIWKKDPIRLIIRKLFRTLVSSKIITKAMEISVQVLEKTTPSSPLVSPLYRWVNGAYMFQGFREGLKRVQSK